MSHKWETMQDYNRNTPALLGTEHELCSLWHSEFWECTRPALVSL